MNNKETSSKFTVVFDSLPTLMNGQALCDFKLPKL